MSLTKFVRNVDDLGDSGGYKFRFRCDRCRDGVENQYVNAKLSTTRVRPTLRHLASRRWTSCVRGLHWRWVSFCLCFGSAPARPVVTLSDAYNARLPDYDINTATTRRAGNAHDRHRTFKRFLKRRFATLAKIRS